MKTFTEYVNEAGQGRTIDIDAKRTTSIEVLSNHKKVMDLLSNYKHKEHPIVKNAYIIQGGKEFQKFWSDSQKKGLDNDFEVL